MKTLNTIRISLLGFVSCSFIVSCYPEGSVSVGDDSDRTETTSEPLAGRSDLDCVARCAQESATTARECAVEAGGACEAEAGSVFGVCAAAECAVAAGPRISMADEVADDLERPGGQLHGLNVDDLVYQDPGLIDVPAGAELPPTNAALSTSPGGHTDPMNFRETAEACENKCTDIVMDAYLRCVKAARATGSNPARCRDDVGESVGACMTLYCPPPRHDEPTRS